MPTDLSTDAFTPSATPVVDGPSGKRSEADPSGRRQVWCYFGGLSLWLALSAPGGVLADIQSSFLLKNQLQATPSQVAAFRLVTAIPLYLAFAFGLVRDRWSPLRLRDRGYFLIFAPLTAAAFAGMAFGRPSYGGLLAGMLLAMVASQFVAAAYSGLLAQVGQGGLMSGRLSTLGYVVAALPAVAASFGSGFISAHLDPGRTFWLVAALALLPACQGLWKPRGVFGPCADPRDAQDSREAPERPPGLMGFVDDVRRLLRCRAVYPAVLVGFLWNFAPGTNTPLQFYLSDRLHAPDSFFSYFNGIFTASFVPTLLLFGFLCKRVPLRKLLWWGTVAAVPQVVPLVFIHSPTQALFLAVPMGLMGGVATAAYGDLAIRSCPRGLHGTLMMLVGGVMALSARGGDVLGTWIYGLSPAHGFAYCVIAVTTVYGLILPVIGLVPRHLIATADGQASPKAGEDTPGDEPPEEDTPEAIVLAGTAVAV